MTKVTKKRVETRTSRTAELTCISRAASSLESNAHYHSDDYLAIRLLPSFFKTLFHFPLVRKFFVHILAPAGIYEYVIARTKYIDAAFEQALAKSFDQILIFGAGFDTRALRFQAKAQKTLIFELDAAPTQQAKIRQYQNRKLSAPANLVFIEIDFDKESLSEKLDQAGFQKERRSLFILEGLLMYLEPESVQSTFQIIRDYAGKGSLIVFDYVQASVLRGENTLFGEAGAAQTVSKAGEGWQFGIEPGEIVSFVMAYNFDIRDHKCVQQLEATYFQDSNGQPIGHINGTHCIVTAVRV
jgi:methyltransferase (TIGR00027 family)